MGEKIEISFDLLSLACKHFNVSYDSYADKTEFACHHIENIPLGELSIFEKRGEVS